MKFSAITVDLARSGPRLFITGGASLSLAEGFYRFHSFSLELALLAVRAFQREPNCSERSRIGAE